LLDPSTGPVSVNWGIAKDWSEQDRYEHGKLEAKVRQFYDAIVDPTEGVLPWLKARW
jgi:hypothetical protein